MLDFGWTEMFLVMGVAIFFIGPEEIPSVMRSVGRLLRRVQYMKYAISRQFDDLIGDDVSGAVNFESHFDDRGQMPDGHEDFDEQAGDEDLDLILPPDERDQDER